MTVLSGTVTSAIIAALSLHAPVEDVDAVPPGVPGVVVVDASSVDADGVSVSSDRPAFVGGRVEVTNRIGVSVAGSGAIFMHDDRLKAISRMNIRVFFIL
jgi:hypothetical protein